jgi:hypothetical protein
MEHTKGVNSLFLKIHDSTLLKDQKGLIIMAFEKGDAGKSTRRLADRRYVGRVIVTLIGVAAMALLLYLMPNFKGIAGLVVVVIIMKFIMELTDKEIKRYEKRERQASRGARAEEKVGDFLKQLPDDYAVFHDIESPYGNIDHVVLNKKNNIFLLETKSHGGEVVYDGKNLLINGKLPEKDFINQILNNIYWLRDEIKKQNGMTVFIKPIIVFTNAFVRVPTPVKNISIINKKFLLKTLTQTQGYKTKVENNPKTVSLFTVLQRLQKVNEDNL